MISSRYLLPPKEPTTIPLYEYKCPACSTIFEKLRPFRDAKLPADCTCGTESPRIVSVPAPAAVQGGTHAQKGYGSLPTLGSFSDNNSWIDA
jgi:putative FmdB family regulatory protein